MSQTKRALRPIPVFNWLESVQSFVWGWPNTSQCRPVLDGIGQEA
jgi:hypothetical protein